MEPVNTALCNTVYNAPAGREDDIAALHVHNHKEGDEVVLTSFWKPSAEELAALNRGGAVMLSILHEAHPAVRLEVSRDPLAN